MCRLVLRPRWAVNLIWAAAGLLLCSQANALVISQVYGGGGNSGAVFTHDFIELFNDSAVAVDLGGLSVQYASATGSNWQQTALAGVLGPYRYYLVQEAAGSGGSTALPPPDAVGGIALSAGSGKVALVNGITSLTTLGCPSAAILDLVGYGSANCAEGTAVTGLSNTAAALRLLGGLRDSGDNASDFVLGPPNPRNSAAPSNPPVAAAPLAAPSSALLLLAGLFALPRRRRNGY